MSEGRAVDAQLDEPTAEEFASLERRAAAYHRSSDPRDLWPDVDEKDIQSAADAIGRAVAGVLVEGHGELRHHSAEAVGIAALVLGVGPLIGYWIEAGRVIADDDVQRVLAIHLRHGRIRADRITSAMTTVVAALNASDIRPAIMKGFHTAHAFFPEPGTRPIADVDVVVRPEEVGRATAVLSDLGYVEGPGLPSPYKREWRPADQDERVRSFHFWHWRSKWNIELHDNVTFMHTLDHGVRFAMMNRFDDRCAALEGARVASGAALVVMLAVHASGELFGSRLLRLVELVLVLRHESAIRPSLWKDVHQGLVDANALRFAYPAFQLTEQLVPGTIDPVVLAATREASTRRARALMSTCTPTSPLLQSGTSLDERLMWAASPWAVLHRYWVMVAPLKGAPWRVVLKTYRSRLHRLLSGTVRWRMAPRRDRPR